MAFFIVLGLLVIASFLIVVLQRGKSKVGLAWFIALVASAAAWFVLFLLRLFLPLNLELLSWVPTELFQGTLALSLDYFSWPYAIAIMTLCVASIFTETTVASKKRLQPTLGGITHAHRAHLGFACQCHTADFNYHLVFN